ncbi:MAG: inhibitor of KinA [Verrucomicrobiota bacterium]|jgi:inhibitor of KinA
MEITPLGDSALVLRVRQTFEDTPNETLDEVLGYFNFLKRANLPGVTELAPAYTTVAIFYDPAQVVAAGAQPHNIFEWLGGRVQTAIANGQVRLTRSRISTIDIPVCYDEKFALDLDEVTQHCGLSAEEVIEQHTGAEYRVSCLGFTPGFPYLSGLPPRLSTPRRPVPRKEVPAGSVAIGGSQTGVYPMTSPGGWNVIGRAPIKLFNPKKFPPAVLCAGDCVRFRAITLEEFGELNR